MAEEGTCKWRLARLARMSN